MCDHSFIQQVLDRVADDERRCLPFFPAAQGAEQLKVVYRPLQGSPSLARGPSLEAGSESAQAPGNLAPEDEDPQDAEGVTEDSLEHRQERLHDVVRPWKIVMHVMQCRRPSRSLSSCIPGACCYC